MTLPSLLLVHGAWHRPDHVSLLVDELGSRRAQAIPVATQEVFAQRADDIERLSSSDFPVSVPTGGAVIRRSLGGSDD